MEAALTADLGGSDALVGRSTVPHRSGSLRISYAQNREDVLLARFFGGQPTGFYIDIGAGDPEQDSVTKHFYDLGWHGINVQPAQANFEELLRRRARDVNLRLLIGDRDGTPRPFELVGGGHSTCVDGHAAAAARDLTVRETALEAISLAELCRRHSPAAIDFLKIDARGWARQIIQGGDWQAYRPRVLVIAAADPAQGQPTHLDWEALVLDAGYLMVHFDGLNRFYLRQEDRQRKDVFAAPANIVDGFRPVSEVRLQARIASLDRSIRVLAGDMPGPRIGGPIDTEPPEAGVGAAGLVDRRPVIWLDIGALLSWPHLHVTGIQRVMLCVLAEIRGMPPGGQVVRFCKYVDGAGFVEPRESEIVDCMRRLDGDLAGAPARSFRRARGKAILRAIVRLRTSSRARIRRSLRHAYRRLPPTIAPESRDLFMAAVRWRRAVGRLLRSLKVGESRSHVTTCAMARGDVLLNIGSSWQQPAHAAAVAELKARLGCRYLVLIHDLIPWMMPEMFDDEGLRPFLAWAPSTLKNADRIMTISRQTRADAYALARSLGIEPNPIEVLRLGHRPTWASFADTPPRYDFARDPAGFVLCVGTIEKRKNHRLLLDVWRELMKRHKPEVVPHLVWVGRRGWLVDDLLADLRRERSLQGRLIWLGEANDGGTDESELEQLYRCCLFTLFPSFYEGWGLPVAESLAHGKLCIASSAASIPEIAGDLLDYHAPTDLQGCLGLVEKAIFDPEYRRRKEREILARYRPSSWDSCVRSLLASCAALAGSAPARSPT